jgi:glutamate carboxypeptidase
VIDMKGGIVVLLLALQALASENGLEAFDLAVYLGGDEEHPGSPLEAARADLRALAAGRDVALGFEDGAGDPRTAVIARRGVSRWTLRVGGRAAHSSQVFSKEVGSGAVYEASRILAGFHEALSGEPLLTVNPGIILGGSAVDLDVDGNRGTAAGKTNIVAESTLVAGDLRAISREQRERAKAAMQRVVATHFPGTDADFSVTDEYPPLAPTGGNRALLALFDAVSRDRGYGPVNAVDPARAGAADISFTAGDIPAALDGIGLMGSGGHTVQETADLATLPMQATRVALLLYRLSRDGLRLPSGSPRRGG